MTTIHTVCFVALAGVLATPCLAAEQAHEANAPSKAAAPIVYSCKDGTTLEMTIRSVDKDEVATVKIGTSLVELPQKMAGSGALYSDDKTVSWHIKGDEGLLQRLPEDKNPQVECSIKHSAKK